jgi:hypothetical protein
VAFAEQIAPCIEERGADWNAAFAKADAGFVERDGEKRVMVEHHEILRGTMYMSFL